MSEWSPLLRMRRKLKAYQTKTLHLQTLGIPVVSILDVCNVPMLDQWLPKTYPNQSQVKWQWRPNTSNRKEKKRLEKVTLPWKYHVNLPFWSFGHPFEGVRCHFVVTVMQTFLKIEFKMSKLKIWTPLKSCDLTEGPLKTKVKTIGTSRFIY